MLETNQAEAARRAYLDDLRERAGVRVEPAYRVEPEHPTDPSKPFLGETQQPGRRPS